MHPMISPRAVASRQALLLFFLLLLSGSVFAQSPGTISGAQKMHAYRMGKTKPLRELTPLPRTASAKQNALKKNNPEFYPPNFSGYTGPTTQHNTALPQGDDPLWQKGFGPQGGTQVLPNFVTEGIDEASTEVGVPDTNGDVSPDNYIQIVNATQFQIFAKDGTALTAPINANTIWSQINQASFSDPVIHYDVDAQRWLLTDLADINLVLYGVSETSDPMGSWFLYEFESDGFTDYPKYGIWPEAYVFTVGDFFTSDSPIFALNRSQMLAGADMVDVQKTVVPNIPGGGFPVVTPVGWSGNTAPASGAKPMFLRINDDAWGNAQQDMLEIWTLDLDWANPDNTSVSLQQLLTTPFDSDPCALSGFNNECVPQPNPNLGIDAIATVIMNKVTYRNFGTHEGFALNFTVDAGNDIAGLRWMEIRRLPGQNWSLHQEGTFAPNDGLHRFIGALALNDRGDIGMAYSVSSATKFPSLRFTGRKFSDPLGEMTVEEFEFASGENARSNSPRYGDYACMSVDPLDNSFWFTSEYVKADGNWGTKIVSFSLGRDSLDIQPTQILSPQNAPDLSASEAVRIRVKNQGLKPAVNFSVGLIFQNGAAVVEPALQDTLLPDAEYVHTFAPTVDMSVIGDYAVTVFTQLVGDQNSNNDTLQKTIRKLPRFDAGITKARNLPAVVCGTSTAFSLEFTNFGTEPLTQVDIQYQLNNGLLQLTNWSGNLPPGATAVVPVTLQGLSDGAYVLSARTLNPSGVLDEVPGNDLFSTTFQVLASGTPVVLELQTDPYPDETTWELQDQSGAVVYAGGPYSKSNFLFTEPWCLDPESCYTFYIFDAFGDGLFGDGGANGSYTIKDAEGKVLASIINVNFGALETNEFCTQSNCTLSADIKITDESAVGAKDGALLITPVSGAGPFEYSITGGQNFQANPLFVNLASGNYAVVVRDANGCLYEDTATVQVFVGTQSPHPAYALVVAPNPSDEGIFRIELSGLAPQTAAGIEVQVLDAAGRVLQYATLVGVDDRYAGVLSLHASPAGLYYLRLMHPGLRELVKVLRL
ncbi:MAG: T9SS type A sorting domain-containing protein [Saprospiraceae bacterium]|nr:T9SS type A sorting domain-containing protein [Saprospiraceae bacterium]